MVGQFEKTRQAENCFPPLPKSKHSRFPHPKKESQVCAPKKLSNKTHLFPPASSTDRVKQQVVAVEVIVLFSFSSSSFSSKRFKGKRNFQEPIFYWPTHPTTQPFFCSFFFSFRTGVYWGLMNCLQKEKQSRHYLSFPSEGKKSRD